MKRLKFLSYFLLVPLILFNSCSSPEDDLEDNDEIPNESSYLQLEIDENYLPLYGDFWVIITNDNGEILADSLVTSGGTIEFIEHENQISDYLGIYLMHIYRESSYYMISAMLSIEKNSSIGFKKAEDHGDPEIGTVEVEISNYPNTSVGSNLLATNNSQGFAYKQSDQIDLDPYDLIYDTIKFKLSIVKENDTLLIGNSYKDNDPRYLKIAGVNDGDSYYFDFEKDFVPYDIIVTHEAPKSDNYDIMSFVIGYKNKSLFYNSMRHTAWISRFTQFGYINGFDNNATDYAVYGYQGYSKVRLYKRGGPVSKEELELPQYSVSITDKAFATFQYSNEQPLAYRKARWTSEDLQSHIYIYENLANRCKQLSSLPGAISAQYDFISLDKLNFSSCEFIDNVEGYDYTRYFGGISDNLPQGNEYKYYSVLIE